MRNNIDFERMEDIAYESRPSWNFYVPGLLLISILYWFGEIRLFYSLELFYFVFVIIHRFSYKYVLTEKKVYARRGLFMKRKEVADLGNVRIVNVRQGTLGWICNYGDLEFISLPEKGPDIRFKGIKNPDQTRELALGLLKKQ